MGSTQVLGLDDAIALFEQRGVLLTLAETDRDAPFSWCTAALAIGALVVAVNEYGGGFESSSRMPSPVYSFAVSRTAVGGRAWSRGDEIEIAHGRTGWLAAPGSTAVTRWGTGHCALHLVVPATEVAAAVAAHEGAWSAVWTGLPREITLDRGPGATLVGLLEVAVGELARGGGSLAMPLVGARYADAVMHALVACAPLPRAKPTEPRVVRDAANYLATHVAEPLRMGEVAAAVGVGLRALQLGFKRHRGQTLAAFLHEHRLQLARARLLAVPTPSVSAIALDCGFAHLGRFSARYRARFGEPPSATARRS